MAIKEMNFLLTLSMESLYQIHSHKNHKNLLSKIISQAEI